MDLRGCWGCSLLVKCTRPGGPCCHLFVQLGPMHMLSVTGWTYSYLGWDGWEPLTIHMEWRSGEGVCAVHRAWLNGAMPLPYNTSPLALKSWGVAVLI